MHKIIKRLTFTDLVLVAGCRHVMSWKDGYRKSKANNQIHVQVGSLLNQTVRQQEIPQWGFKVFASICSSKPTILLIREICWASSKPMQLCRCGSSQQRKIPWKRNRFEHLPLCLTPIRAANKLRQGLAAEGIIPLFSWPTECCHGGGLDLLCQWHPDLYKQLWGQQDWESEHSPGTGEVTSEILHLALCHSLLDRQWGPGTSPEKQGGGQCLLPGNKWGNGWSCTRWCLSWILGTLSSLKGLSSIGTECPGKWWSHHPFKRCVDVMLRDMIL